MAENQELTTKHEAEVAETNRLVEICGASLVLSDDDTIADNPLLALSDLERGWVEAYSVLAGEYGAATKSARYAGYAPGTEATKGSQCLRRPRVIKALKYLAETKAHTSALMAMNTLARLSREGTDAIQLKASEKMLAFSGIIAATLHRHEHEIADNRDEAAIEAEVVARAQALGIPIGQLIEVPKRPTTNPKGAPHYKRVLAPNREMTDEEIDEIDWSRVEV